MSDVSSRPSMSKKRSSGWFGSGNKRKSVFFGSQRIDEDIASNGYGEGGAVQPVHRGPPPPTLPEFREFGSLDGVMDGNGHLGSLGAEEMFKDIK